MSSGCFILLCTEDTTKSLYDQVEQVSKQRLENFMQEGGMTAAVSLSFPADVKSPLTLYLQGAVQCPQYADSHEADCSSPWTGSSSLP